MKASAARDILFAHAIDTAAPNEALPDAARREAITQDVLHSLGKPATSGKAGQAAFVQFLQARAVRIIQASQLPADVRQLWQHAPGLARWLPLVIMLAALVAGFVSHRITDPHRVDLLSLSLIGIVVWNLLVYAWLLLHGAWRLAKPQHRAMVPLQPTQGEANTAAAAAEGSPGFLQRLRGKAMPALRGSGLRKMALTFERNWWQASQPVRHAQWLLWLHLGAALMALGALASLWLTGLTKEYQLGWESTFLSAPQVQQWLNSLFAPVQWLGLVPRWELGEIQSLQGWVTQAHLRAAPAGGASAAERWVLAYTLLLAVLVIAPRLLLALWQAVRWRWQASHVQLPLNQAYFAQLQRDFGGLATHLVVQPYSMDMTPERKAAIEQYSTAQYGAGASIEWRATLAYGAALPEFEVAAPAQPVALINLAATPEAEIHGELLAQLRRRYGAQAQLWLWTSDFAQRNAGAPRRTQERTALWQEFAQQYGFSVHLVGAASA